MRFNIDLSIFRGPLDLLLYLVRKQELDVTDISVASVTNQYLDYLAVLEQIDVNSAGEWLEMASRLIEIKSRMILPRCEEKEEELDDPRQELVRRLLEYKLYRDAASMLEERGREWRNRYPRLVSVKTSNVQEPEVQAIHDVELWDLISALERLMREKPRPQGPESIRYDDTPIRVYMIRIHRQLAENQRVAFSALFDSAAHRSNVISMFLALLELMRHGCARGDQQQLFGEIWLEVGDRPLPENVDLIDGYDGRTTTKPESTSAFEGSAEA